VLQVPLCGLQRIYRAQWGRTVKRFELHVEAKDLLIELPFDRGATST